MKFRITAAIAALTLSHHAFAASWGVIASTYDTLREYHLVSDGTLTEALQEVVQTCRKQSPGQDCFAVAAVQDGCLAWAVDRRGNWGWAQSLGARPNAEAMVQLHRKALDQCNQDPNAGRCRVVRTICTEDRERDS